MKLGRGRPGGRSVWAIVVVATALLASPVHASAATRVGQTVDPRSSLCTPDTFLQPVSPGRQYMVPFDGVLTSWSFQAGSMPFTPLKLKVGTVGPNRLTIHGESAFEQPATGQMNTFSARVPAAAHDVLGFAGPGHTGTSGQCAAVKQSGFVDAVREGDIPPGETSSPITEESSQLDVSAILEPDCDKDGLGDETQDGDLSSCPLCKGRTSTIVGSRRKDVLSGSYGTDVIVGLGGKDKLSGLGGNDVICGGPGKDVLNGGKGKDKLYGEAGNDILRGGPGKDKLKGGPGKDKQIQ
jgi:hemolysin type calcium-binding protein